MSNHTPGPWTLDEDSYTVLGDGRNVARVHTVDDFICDGDDAEVAEECAANAAPDLYEALELAHREIRAWRDGLNHRDMNKAKVGAIYVPEGIILAALRKARGEAL